MKTYICHSNDKIFFCTNLIFEIYSGFPIFSCFRFSASNCRRPAHWQQRSCFTSTWLSVQVRWSIGHWSVSISWDSPYNVHFYFQRPRDGESKHCGGQICTQLSGSTGLTLMKPRVLSKMLVCIMSSLLRAENEQISAVSTGKNGREKVKIEIKKMMTELTDGSVSLFSATLVQ